MNMEKEDALSLLHEVTFIIKTPVANANGGGMLASAAYWRLSKVLKAYLEPMLEAQEGKSCADFVKQKYGVLTTPREAIERKIVQIAEGGVEGALGRWDADAWTTALCNDASVWRLHGGEDAVWYRMPPIPQDATQ